LENLDTLYETEVRPNHNDTPAVGAPAFKIIAAEDSLLDEFAAESGSSEQPILSEPGGDAVPSPIDAPKGNQPQFGRRKLFAAVATLAVGLGLHSLLPDRPAPPAPSPLPRAPYVTAAPTGTIAGTPTSPVTPPLTVQDQSRQTPASPALDPVTPPRAAVVTTTKPEPLATKPMDEGGVEITAPPVVASPLESVAPAAVVPAPEPNAEAIVEVRHETEIRSVLDAYRDSYERLDAVSAARLWPGVDTAALSKAFSTLSMQEVEFDSCSLGVTDQSATANCNGSLRYVRKVGSSAPQSRALAWTFELERSAGRWLITRVTAK
jgi:hypothetical protein